MATIRRFFSKKISKDFEKSSEGSYSVTDDSSVPNNETGEKRRIRSLSISRSGRFKQKKRERGALHDRPDLYHTPTKQSDVDDNWKSADDKQDNMTAVRKETTPANNNFERRVPEQSEGVNLYQNQPRQTLEGESSTDGGLRESATATFMQATDNATNGNNSHSINKIKRPGYNGPETSGRYSTQATMV